MSVWLIRLLKVPLQHTVPPEHAVAHKHMIREHTTPEHTTSEHTTLEPTTLENTTQVHKQIKFATPESAAYEFAALRAQCDALVHGDQVDKEVALGIIKLFHTSETMMLALRFAKQQEVDKLRHELDLTRVTHRNIEMMQSLAEDVARLKVERKDDNNTLRAHMATVDLHLQSTKRR